MQEIGESITAWGTDVWRQAEDIASKLRSEVKPFYIVYAAKQDKSNPHKFNQAFRLYRDRPPRIIGILVWYVDNSKGIFELVPDLSVPPDVPIDPSLLSTKSQDACPELMEMGKKMGILLS